MRRSNANPLRTQDQHDDIDCRQPRDAPGTFHAVSNEMEALRLVNQRLLKELEELTRQGQRPKETQQAHEGCNTLPHEEQRHLINPLDVGEGEENSQNREHDPYRPAGDGNDGEAQGRNDEGYNPIPCQPEKGAQYWEQRFRGIQQELGHIK